ncbi:MAG: HipA family kinase, partial [Cyanobacteria bacterium P01_D01_bin.6]
MYGALPTYKALRIVSAQKRGSSRPVVVETNAGYFFTKLRGAAQGTAALIAEIMVAELAEALDLWIPSQALIQMDASTPSEVQEDEFLDLLAASSGINLGLQYLREARDIRPSEIAAIDEETACKVLWLDSFVMNVDRTVKNPN